MKNILKFAFVAAMALSFTAAANAQVASVTTGSGTVNGQIQRSVDLRSAGDPSEVGGGATMTNHSAQNSGLSFAINFGDVSPNNSTVTATQQFVYATVGMQLRSNAAYQVLASRAGNVATGTANSGSLKAGDVALALLPAVKLGDGALVFAGGDSGADRGSFAGTSTIGSVNNGQPTYTSSLNDVAVGSTPSTVLVDGSRISNGGDNSSNNNAITMKMRFAIKPQYYDATSASPVSFGETLTLSMIPKP